jgi:hypothetical protein
MSVHINSQNAASLLTRAGDQAIEDLIDEVRSHMSIMFKICEAIALLDMVGHISVGYNYTS